MNLTSSLRNISQQLCKHLNRLPGREPDWDLETLRYVVLDTETTGFDYGRDRILSLGALSLQYETIDVGDCLEIYFQQEFYNEATTEIHGILSREVRTCLPEKEGLEKFIQYLGDDVIVAHHARFDLTMINNALHRHGFPKLQNPHLDTSALYRKTVIDSPVVSKKERYTLDELADKFDISKKDRHTALGDALITAIAFLKILEALRKKGITTFRQARR